ncbi:DUF4352 domain-containing protein [bacterium]|nr:DUF4352 domain-containing protein [bacterium]
MLKIKFKNIWKYSKIVLASACIATALTSPTASFAEDPASVYVNGMKVEATPYVQDGTTYLPIQVIAQALKSEIIWDANLNSVKVNGQPVKTEAINRGGRIYLPIESLISSLGGTVSFDGLHNRILITPADSTYSYNRNTPTAKTTTSSTPKTDNKNKTGSTFSPSISPTVTLPRPTTPAVTTPVVSSTATTAATPNNPSPSAKTIDTVSAVTRNSTVQPGYPVAYTPNQPQNQKGIVHSVDGASRLPSNLRTGPIQGMPNVMTGGSAGLPTDAQRITGTGKVYVPQHAQNSTFRVTVTNLETISMFKDFYKPKEGNKYVVVYLSQQNVSQQVQIYTGRFSLLDQKSVAYDYIEGLSNFWLVILRPYGVNFGYLVFEVPADAKPVSLVLHSLNQAPLAVSL